MTTIVRRTKGILSRSLKEPAKNSQDILDELILIESDLQKRIETTKQEVEIWEGHATRWGWRINYAENKKAQADTVDGEQAMEILRNQAVRYAEFYKIKKVNSEKELNDLKDSYSKIVDVIRGLKTVEKTKNLDERLRQMASKENIQIQEEDNAVDMRAIAQATHTAKALLELQTSR